MMALWVSLDRSCITSLRYPHRKDVYVYDQTSCLIWDK